MRWIFLCFWPWAFTVQGQVIWNFNEELDNYDAWIRDIKETNTGYLLVGRSFQVPFSSAAVVLRTLDENGTQVLASSILQGVNGPDASSLMLGATPGTNLAFGVLGGDSAGFFRYEFDDALVPLDTTYYLDSVSNHIYMENVVLTGNGGALLLGGGANPSGSPVRSELLLLNSLGEVVNWRSMEALTGIHMPMHGIRDSSGFIVSVIGSAQLFGNYSSSEFQYFSSDLAPLEGVAGPQLWIGDPMTGVSVTFTDNPCILPLPSGNLIVSGTYGNFGNGYGALLVRMDRDGEVLGNFYPLHPFIYDHTAALEAIHSDADGNILFCQVENLQFSSDGAGGITPHNPSEPSRIRVMKLDTAFNVLCEYLIDGFDSTDDSYYIPTRIKLTSDGNILVIGSRKRLNGTNRTGLWATKISSDACINGVAEFSSLRMASLFPNPGRGNITLMLNGEASNGTLILQDALGRLCNTVPMRQGQAQFNVEELAIGIYTFRVLDTIGGTLAIGKWVKD